MRTLKVNTTFKIKTDATILQNGLTILQAMTDNANFPSPTPSLENIQAAIDDYQLKLAKANQKGSPLDISLKNESKMILVSLLQQLAYYVNNIGKGNLPVLLSSGFPLAERPIYGLIPAVPQRVKLSDGALSGQIRLDFDPLGTRTMYEYCYAAERDEQGELRWSDRITTTSSRKNILAGLTPGQTYYVRVRGVNSNGAGDWCEPVSLIVR